VSKFNNTGGQFAADVKDTDGITWGVAVFADFLTIQNGAEGTYTMVAWGKTICEKKFN
jgi:hypothetical protein